MKITDMDDDALRALLVRFVADFLRCGGDVVDVALVGSPPVYVLRIDTATLVAANQVVAGAERETAVGGGIGTRLLSFR